jgi:DNA-binding response OmpR family regulator
VPATILVAEDDPDLLQFLVLLLEREGHTVLRAGDGEQALALAEREHPDLIISDIMMPRLSGLDLAAELRARENGHGPPILLLSAVGPGALPERTRFLPKPFDMNALLRAVASLLPATSHG